MEKVERGKQIRRILIIILVLNLAVAAAKLVVGFITNSNAMKADGIHSSLDGISNVVGLIGIALASRPADKEHPYGHRRFETLASLMIGAMILVTAWELVNSSIANLREGVQPTISAINFITMIVTLLINLGVSTYEKAQGKRLNSELLTADSEHTKSDFFVSSLVIVGLIGVRLGFSWADAVASLLVVILIGFTAFKVLRDAAGILVDRAAVAESDVKDVLSGIAGVESIESVKSRGPEDEFYLDISIKAPSTLTIAQLREFSDQIRAALKARFGGLKEVQIEFLPDETDNTIYHLTRMKAEMMNLSIHELLISSTDEGLLIDCHVEVPPDQTVGEAHAVVSAFEEALIKENPGIFSVISHIEPLLVERKPLKSKTKAGDITREVKALLSRHFSTFQYHDLRMMEAVDGSINISMHTRFPAEMPLEEAHSLIEQVEMAIRSEIEPVDRVTIHVEPEGEEV